MELLSATSAAKADLKKEQALLEKEKAALLRNAKKLIDLSHKILVLLETPKTSLFAAMMPLLSHDAWEVEYDFVDTFAGIKTKSNVLKDHHLEARINILADINECSRKRSCGTLESVKNNLELAGKYDKRDIEKAVTAARDAGYFD